jgi:shikimate dehydrogenase
VNTLVPHGDGHWLGTNTDVEGFLAPLRQRDPAAWPDCQAVVLGCGGSARAVVAGLVELGVSRIGVAARRQDALEAFGGSCAGWAPQLELLAWDSLSGHLDQLDLLVNTTPVGMASRSDPDADRRCPLQHEQLERLPAGSTVYDLIYTPRPTALLRAAAERACLAVDGLEMLVQQGAAALRLWTGLDEVPVAAMRSAALRALEG